MRIHQEDSFVLRTTPFSESSLIVDVFTRNYGRINLLAKGARRIKSRFRGTIRSFQLLQASWSGKGNVPTLTGLTSNAQYVEIGGERLYCSFYMNELIMRLLQARDPHPDLFDAYYIALERLAEPSNEFHSLRVFEKILLQEIGYALVLDTEADRKTPLSRNKFYLYDFNAGPLPANKEDTGAVTGETLFAIAQEKFLSNQVKSESRKLLGRAVANYLDGKALHCRDIYSQTIRDI
jgi:DNA repair protein RecO (recombination protein O)